jgi:hypothetical protein
MSTEPVIDPDGSPPSGTDSLVVRVAVVLGLAAVVAGFLLLRPGAIKPPEPVRVAEPTKPVEPAPIEAPKAATAPVAPAKTEAQPHVSREEVIKAIKLAGSDDPALAASRQLERAEKVDAVKAEQKRAAERTAIKSKRAAEKRDRAEREQIIEEVASEWESRPPGGLSEAEFHETLLKWAGVKQCLQNHNKRTAEATGTLRVKFKIASTGQVEQSQAYYKSNEIAKEIAPCVEQEAMQLRFPSFTGSGAIMRRATFLF